MKEFNTIINAYTQNLFSRGGETQDILALINALPDKHITDDKDRNLYHIVATYADYKAIALLAEAGVKPRVDEDNNTPLHALANSPLTNEIKNFEKWSEDIYKTVQKLLELKVNPKRKNETGQIAYFVAGVKTMYPFLLALADAGVKMDAVGDENKNILHVVTSQLYHRKNVAGVIEASAKTIKILLDSGLDPEDKDLFDTTPLTYAQRSEVKEIAALLSGDSDALKTGGMTLEQAILQNDIEAVEALILSGSDINEVSENVRTPLMTACSYSSVEMVKLLLKHHADVNYISGENEQTAIYYLLSKAKEQESKKVIKTLQVLIDGGLNINNSIDNKGNTAINFICGMDHVEGVNRLAEALVDATCDVNIPNLTGKTPLMTFAACGDETRYNIAELLLDNDADVNAVDQNSCNALMYAAQNPNKMSGKKIVELLLDQNSIVLDATNNKSETALDIAIANENEAVVKLLLAKM